MRCMGLAGMGIAPAGLGIPIGLWAPIPVPIPAVIEGCDMDCWLA